MLEYLSALGFLGNPVYWLTLLVAVFLVGAVGLVPGVGSTTIMVLALPFLVFEVRDPVIGLTFLAAMNGLANTLDSVPAVLLGYPSGATQVTFLEGHQLAMRGQAAYTLGAVYAASALGGVVGALALLAALPFIRPILNQISFPEVAALGLFGVLMVSALSRGAMLKGLIAGLLGILLGTIGTSYISGLPRFDMGLLFLFDGLPLVPAAIGLFALPELVDLTMRGQPVGVSGSVSNSEVFRGAREGFRRWRMTVRQILFGVFLGAVPGIGAAVIDWLAYAFGIAFAKDKSTFGKGNLEGVLFAESAQNSKEGGQAIPTLAFGVPGGLQWSLILVAMTIYGVHPGLTMLGRDLDVTMSIIVTLALGNLLVTLLGIVATGQLAKLTLVPFPLLAALLLPLTFIAAFLSNFHWGDIATVWAMFILGMAMKWLGWPRPPLLLGFILGPVIEQNLWPSVQLWGWGFWTRPLTIGLVVAAIAAVTYLTRAMGRAEAAVPVEGEGLPFQEQSPQRPMASPSATIGVGEDAVPSVAGGPSPESGPRGPALIRVPEPSKGGIKLALPRPTLWSTWVWDAVFTLLVLGLVLWFFFEAQTFRHAEGRFLPTYIGLAMMPLLALQILLLSFRPRREGDIMDLGMRSGTGWESLQKLGTTLVWLGGFMLLTVLIGMPAAAVVFALLFGVTQVKLEGRRRLWTLLPCVLTAFLIFLVFENLMVIEWPANAVSAWLLP